MLREALNYLTLDLSVIPLKPRSKEPLIKWAEFQSRRASEDEIQNWFTQWPNANVGIVTGLISGVAIVDLDGPEGLKEWERLSLTESVMTPPLMSLTGKGRHLWFRNPKDVLLQNAVRAFPGIDLRAEGGYVLAPPSIHPNGSRYRFNRKLSASLVTQLPPFPVSCFAENVAISTVTSAVNSRDGVNLDVKPRLDVAKALEEMKEGNIDETLFKVCAKFRNAGFSESETFSLLDGPARSRGATDGHLQDKIDNVWGRYEAKGNNGRPISSNIANGKLTLHSPTNPDSLDQYARLQMAVSQSDSIRTGYPLFDTLSKGLKKGEVLTVAARTGVGKTNWIITPIRTFCAAGKSVLLFSTEMSFDQIWSRYCATLSVKSNFGRHKFTICDEFTPNIERIEEAIKNVSPDLFVFDHISHIGTDYHIISKFMSEIKRMARLYNIPAIVTAQLNRNADYVDQGQRIEPRLSHIQGSDQIGQMSAQVLLLNEKRIVGDVTEIEGLIVKNRHGDKGLISFGLVKSPAYKMIEL